jgi:hypothetical protein
MKKLAKIVMNLLQKNQMTILNATLIKFQNKHVEKSIIYTSFEILIHFLLAWLVKQRIMP